MDKVCEPVIRRRAERHLKSRVVIFAAGVGAPISPPIPALLRAAEMRCDACRDQRGRRLNADPKHDPGKAL
jgi:uridylate kinase